MEKVQAGSLTEEFSFSRALHLMQYGNAKCRFKDSKKERFYVNPFGELVFSQKINNTWIDSVPVGLRTDWIMGGWTMYDERIHG